CLQLNRGAMAFIIPPSGLFNSHQTLMAYSAVFKLPLISTAMIPSFSPENSQSKIPKSYPWPSFESSASQIRSSASNQERDHLIIIVISHHHHHLDMETLHFIYIQILLEQSSKQSNIINGQISFFYTIPILNPEEDEEK
ncbi:hypothetical protein DERF_007012, partial [Dermatophagoides farinae]